MSNVRTIESLFEAEAVRRGTHFTVTTKGGKVKQARVLYVEELDVMSVPSRAITYAMLGRRERVTSVQTVFAPFGGRAAE